MPAIKIFAFCAFVVAAVFGFIRKDYSHGFGWTGMALLTIP